MAKNNNKNKKTSTVKKSKPVAKSAKKPTTTKAKPAKKVLKKKVVPKQTAKEKKKEVKKVVAKKATPKKIAVAAKKKPIKVTKKVVEPIVNKAKPDKKVIKKVDKKEKDKKIKASKPVSTFIKESSELDKIKALKNRPTKSRRGRKKKSKKQDDDEPEILHDELVEQLIRAAKKPKTPPKGPKIIKTFVNPITSLTVASTTNDANKKNLIPKKEPKGKYSIEYVIRTSAPLLYEFIATPSGLSDWFADDVNIHDGIFTFIWDGSEQKAALLAFKENEFIRLKWNDKPEGYYFEFRIQLDDITGDVSLIITDFADEASDMETSRRLWDSQIDKLLHILGSY
jgi:hypothetical protein